jgi:hypothetical protein
MSALPPEADIRVPHRHVCFGPKGDIRVCCRIEPRGITSGGIADTQIDSRCRGPKWDETRMNPYSDWL